MVDSEKQSDFNVKGLSLIDVSSEDDCLINSPLCEPINPPSSEKGSGTKTVRFAMDPNSVEISLGSIEEVGKLKEPPDSSEQGNTRKNGKYNLRKSLAWDSAFFTSAGFLEPDELSSMLGGNEKDQIHTLPGIQEDVNKSCDSLTTLDSETLTLESLEADLFEDVRASIQKFNKVSNTANSSGKRELKTTDTRTVSSSKKVDFTTQDKVPPKNVCMLGGNEKGQIHTLPGIQEDVNKSYDSLTTLDSETLTLESLEADLFEDVRASIQKSNKVSNTANSSGKKELKSADNQTVSFSKKVEFTTKDKMKQKSTPKKLNIDVKDSGKTPKQVLVRPQISQTVQSVARSGESTSSLHKPPKVLSRVGPLSTTPTKRVSLGAKNVKTEKDAKNVTVAGRGTTVLKASTLGGARNIVPRPKLSSKSSSCSPASSKTEVTTSCSSLESFASVSSDRINKSSLNLIKPKNGSRIVNLSSSGNTNSTRSKIAPKGKIEAGSSMLATFLKSSTKLSSSISPASSISEWSSESSSSISAANQRSNVVRASLGTGSCKGLTSNCDAHQVLDSQNHPTGHCSQGDAAEVTGSLNESENKVSAGNSVLLHPALMKPSGLRMPSPKIGFFDGVRSSVRTPNGSMLSHLCVPSGLPKIGAKSNSPSGSSNKAKIGKLQPVRAVTAIQSPKVDVKQTSSTVKSRSSLSVQKSTIAATNVPSASRNPKTSPGISLKLQSKFSPKQVVGLGGKDGTCMKDTKIVPVDGVPETTADFVSKSKVENTIASKEATENETNSYPYHTTDTLPLYDTNKKVETPVKYQTAGLVRNSGAVQEEPIIDCNLGYCHKEFENSLSNPTPTSPSPMTSEITCSSRIPFTVKDSFYNMDAPLDVLSGSVMVVDKTTILPFSESILPENS